MKATEREKAIQLRLEEEWSYGAIARELKVAKSTLSTWLKDLPLSEERMLELRRSGWQKGELKRERFRETMRTKRLLRESEIYEEQLKQFSNLEEQAIFVAGLMLYEAEGEKKSTADISFTNTDSKLIRFFSEWLTHFLDIPKEKMRLQLRLYENMDIQKEEEYWLEQVGVERSQLWRTQVRALRKGSFTYKDTSRHGTCRLYVGSVPKKSRLRLSTRAFFDTYSRHMHA